MGCAGHRHFVAGCRGCRIESAAYNLRRNRAIRAGTWTGGLADSARTRARIAELQAQGMGLTRIAAAARLGRATVEQARRNRYVHRQTEAAILAVQPVAAPIPAGQVAALGTTRRLQALAAAGWSTGELSRRLGRCVTWVRRLLAGERAAVRQATADRVAELFAALLLERPPSGQGATKARAHAAANGWAPALAWDDIDDPAAVPCLGADVDELPDPVAAERLVSGERIAVRPQDRQEAVRRLVEAGETQTAIERRLRLSGETARRLVEKAKEAAA